MASPQNHGVPYRYVDSLLKLADCCDFLVVSVPGGAATRHFVNDPVLKALGPHGFVVNVARGGIVDTDALVCALQAGEIGGAGLDVFESEPLLPQALLNLPNVVLTPHVAGTSPEAKLATLNHFINNAELHFKGQPVRTPIG